MNRKGGGGEISSPLIYEEVATIATIVDLVTEVIQPAIKEPFELVDVEYGKMGGDYDLKHFRRQTRRDHTE